MSQGATTSVDAVLKGRFGRYEIDRLLGRGGMGAVYLARQVDLDRPVVIKVIAPELARDHVVVERLHREARAAAKVNSDSVVKVYETGVEAGVPFIAMEYIDGFSAQAILQKRGRIPHAEATKLVLAAARGLKAAHDVGILHRDVKPANILITRDGRVKVADFGLAKLNPREKQGGGAEAGEKTLSIAGEILGTPEYMPPEQADGKPLDARADIYSLGVTYFELLTGTRPFKGNSPLHTLALVFSAPIPPPRQFAPDLPEPVERACLTLMARELDQRPQNAQAAIDLLHALLRPGAGGALSGTIEGASRVGLVSSVASGTVARSASERIGSSLLANGAPTAAGASPSGLAASAAASSGGAASVDAPTVREPGSTATPPRRLALLPIVTAVAVVGIVLGVAAVSIGRARREAEAQKEQLERETAKAKEADAKAKEAEEKAKEAEAKAEKARLEREKAEADAKAKADADAKAKAEQDRLDHEKAAAETEKAREQTEKDQQAHDAEVLAQAKAKRAEEGARLEREKAEREKEEKARLEREKAHDHPQPAPAPADPAAAEVTFKRELVGALKHRDIPRAEAAVDDLRKAAPKAPLIEDGSRVVGFMKTLRDRYLASTGGHGNYQHDSLDTIFKSIIERGGISPREERMGGDVKVRMAAMLHAAADNMRKVPGALVPGLPKPKEDLRALCDRLGVQVPEGAGKKRDKDKD